MSDRTLAVSMALLLAACGDPKFADEAADPTAPPPGATTNPGSVSASINGVRFFGRLSSEATVAENRLVFSAYDGFTTQLSISVQATGPGVFDAGGPNNPIVSLTEESDGGTRLWTSPPTTGFGAITFTFLTEDRGIGHFFFSLVPDSATAAAGFTTRRNVTAGTFNVAISR